MLARVYSLDVRTEVLFLMLGLKYYFRSELRSSKITALLQNSVVTSTDLSLRGCSQIKIIILNVIVTFGGEGGKPCDVSNVNILKNISNCFFIVLQL